MNATKARSSSSSKALEPVGAPSGAVAVSLAGVRDRLEEYRLSHPTHAVSTRAPVALDAETKGQIHQRHLRGVSLDVLAVEYGRTRTGITRVINEARANRLLDSKLDYIASPEFDDPAMQAEIFGPMPEPVNGQASRAGKAPDGLPPYLASLYDDPLLSREQERHLFRRMNALKHHASVLRNRIDPARAKAADLDRVEALQDEALAVKNQLIKANLRLVVSIAKRHIAPSRSFFELVSDGNISLIKAVEKFDYSRGNKFSTYASWAIIRNFGRTIPEENNRRDRFSTGHDPRMFESTADNRSDAHEHEVSQKRNRETVQGMLGHLDERERRIITSRFGLNGASEQTLEQLGRELGITKERVRQIESRVQQKLRKMASETELDIALT